MHIDHTPARFRIRNKIFPIYERKIFGDFLFPFCRNGVAARFVHVSLADRMEKHIRPHFAAKAVFFRDRKHLFQVRKHDLRLVFMPVLIEIFPRTQKVRLVHADIDPAARIHCRGRGKHLIDQFVRRRLVDEQNIFDVDDRAVALIIFEKMQVRQRLNGRNKFDSPFAAVCV